MDVEAKHLPYTDFMFEEAKKPPLLWHYTSGAGLLGIVNSRELWCSEFRFLNDKEELFHFAQSLIEAWLGACGDALSAEDRDKVANVTSLYRTYHVFIGALCGDGDSNLHWAQYARRAGYALGFDPQDLRRVAKEQEFRIAPVMYGNAETIAEAVIQDKLESWGSFRSPLSSEHLDDLTSSIIKEILWLAPFFKQGGFSDEKEWRLVKVCRVDQITSMGFTARGSFGISTYYPLKIRPSRKYRISAIVTNKKAESPLRRIVVGPGNDTEPYLGVKTIGDLLERNGLSATVSETKSSLRFSG